MAATAYAVLLCFQVALVIVLVAQRGLILADPMAHSVAWWRNWGGNQRDYAYDAAVAGGALYVTGATFSLGETPEKLLLLRYEKNGTLSWNVTYGVGGYSMGRGIASDGSSLYVAGIRIDGSGARSLLLKYGLDGSLVWEREWSPGSDAKASGLAIDSSGNPYVTGYVEASLIENRAFLLKYDGDGDLTYSRVFPANGTETAWGVSVSDAVYLCGETTHNTTAVEETGVAQANALLMKVSLDGDLLWRREVKVGLDNVANAVDASQDIIVVGYSSYSNGTARALVLRYDENGEILYKDLFGNALIEDLAWGVDVAGDYTYVVGSTRSLFTDLSDATTLKLGQDDSHLWQDSYADYSLDRARGVAVGGDEIYVVGETYWRTLDMQVLVVKYESANSALPPWSSDALRLSLMALCETAQGVVTRPLPINTRGG
jgi:hypothetical protein